MFRSIIIFVISCKGIGKLEDITTRENLQKGFRRVVFLSPLEWENMAILDQPHVEVGSSVFVPAARVSGEVLAVSVELQADPTSAELIQQYTEFRDGAASLVHSEGEVLDGIRAEVGGWLADHATDVAPEHAEVDSQAAAFGRVASLTTHLRWSRPNGIRGFELDTSTTLVEAALVHAEEVAAGTTTPEAFPDPGTDPEWAMPLLRYVPEDQRPALLHGLPATITQLAPEAQLVQPEQTHTPSFWEKARALGGRALEKIHHRKKTSEVLGQTAVAAEVAVVANESPASPAAVSEANAEPDRFVDIPGTGRLKFVSYYDHPNLEGLTSDVDNGQRTQYIKHGIWKPDAKGGLARGSNVEILALVDPETNVPVASLRKIHINAGVGADQLPSVKKFNEERAFLPDGFAAFEACAKGRDTVEVASLWKDTGHGTSVTVALYKEAIHQSIERDEVWIMGVVAPELRLLLAAYGPQVVRVISSPISVHDGEATSKVRLRAAYLDPATYFDDMMDEIAVEKDDPDPKIQATGLRREVLLWRFLKGLPRQYLSEATLHRLETV
jgi:hypothetical protein